MANEKCKCGCKNLKHYDWRLRKVYDKGRVAVPIKVERLKCKDCGHMTLRYPDDVVRYKQYNKYIYDGVTEGLITPETLGFEDYPSEKTMNRWIKEKEDKPST